MQRHIGGLLLPVLFETLALKNPTCYAILQLEDTIHVLPDLSRQLKIDVSAGMPSSQSVPTAMSFLQIDHSLKWIVG